MNFKKVTSIVLSVLVAFAINNLCCCFADEVKDAELLYTQITKFLDEHKDVDTEHFDDVCREFMNEGAPKANLLSRSDFEERSKGNIVLYRGVFEKKYADEFKQGKILASGYKYRNARGMGIYTTTSLAAAKGYSGGTSDTVIKMFIPKDRKKILDYNYLEKLKKIIIEKHSENFGRLSYEVRSRIYYDYHIYDEKIWDYGRKKVKELGRKASYEEEEKFRSEFREKLEREDPAFRKLLEEKAYSEMSKDARVWDDAGLITKLMGFDALCTQDASIGSGIDGQIAEEYLIVNPNALYVLAE